MKRKRYLSFILIAELIVLLLFSFVKCRKTENPVMFPKGTFPDSIINLSGINSSYDDYNLDVNVLKADNTLIFSSNRGSGGGQFDLIQGSFSYAFSQETGLFELYGVMTDDVFLSRRISKVNTAGNDFGPYHIFSPLDGYEYFIVSSVNSDGNLDFLYTKNLPYFGKSVPEILGPYPVNILNSISDEVYICFDSNQDSVYFASNSDGNFDIYFREKNPQTIMEEWLNLDYAVSLKADVLNSSGDDKCPFIYRKIMIFASDRQGGLGGFDLYYSLFTGGNWSTPVNLGPPVNSVSDEYRPVLGSDEEFTNMFLMFSSNRSGGKGGFDIYFTGINLGE